MHRLLVRPPHALAVLALVVAGLLALAYQHPRAAAGRDTLLVALTDGADESGLNETLMAAQATVAGRVDQLHLLVVNAPAKHADALLSRLQASDAVRYAVRESHFEVTAAPNDEMYAAGSQWGLDKIHAPEAWDLLPEGGNTVVAVLDTGIDYDHPEFAGRISRYSCDRFHGRCMDGSGQAPAYDDNYHGTHVAGIIGANTGNRTGVASVTAGRVTLLPIKVLSIGGGVVYESIIIDALMYAVDHGAKVVNMSFGGPCGEEVSPALKDAIAYADNHDVTMVMAAGNSGGCRQGRYPQSDQRVLSVAATDALDVGAVFTDNGSWVSVAAPGVRILSTIPMVRGGYATLSGTSMAAPHVAGAAALLYQVPGATKAKVKEWLMSTCDPASVYVACGGRINLYRAMSLAVKGVDPAKAAPVTTDPSPQGPAATSASGSPEDPPAAPAPTGAGG